MLFLTIMEILFIGWVVSKSKKDARNKISQAQLFPYFCDFITPEFEHSWLLEIRKLRDLLYSQCQSGSRSSYLLVTFSLSMAYLKTDPSLLLSKGPNVMIKLGILSPLPSQSKSAPAIQFQTQSNKDNDKYWENLYCRGGQNLRRSKSENLLHKSHKKWGVKFEFRGVSMLLNVFVAWGCLTLDVEGFMVAMNVLLNRAKIAEILSISVTGWEDSIWDLFDR